MITDLHREKNYLDFMLAYLKSAEICAETFLVAQNDKSIKYANYLFIPAIYNLKHSFEVAGKFLLVRKLNIPPSQIKNYGHDFDKIIDDFSKKYYKSKTTKDIVNLKALFNKYATMPAINVRLKEMKVTPTQDLKNQFFHYPEGNKCHRDIFYYGLIAIQKSNMVSFMTELKDDVHELNKTFANIIHSKKFSGSPN